jgi:hypothetical protein
VCRLDGGIQDFDELVDAVENRCASGTPVKEQGTEGNWSDRVN